MSYTDVLYEVKNQIAWLTINRPDKGNTFRRQTVLELIAASTRRATTRACAWSCSRGRAIASSASAGRRSPTTGSSIITACPPWWISTASSISCPCP